jgi:PAS domain S-box-containing protein
LGKRGWAWRAVERVRLSRAWRPRNHLADGTEPSAPFTRVATEPLTPEAPEHGERVARSPWRHRHSALLRDLFTMLLVGLTYWGAAELSLRLALVERNVTPVWPPTGIALVSFLVFGPRMWPAIAVAAFVVNAPISPSPLAALAIASGNTLSPLVALLLLRRVGFRPELDRLRDALAIVCLGALVGMLVSATIGSTALALSGAVPLAAYGSTWAVWWTGDAMGVLVFAPFLLSLGTRRPGGATSWLRRIEAAVLFLGLAVVSYAAFRSRLEIQYLVFLFLGWAAWRFELRGAAPAALLASGIAVWAAVRGFGPFEQGTLFEKMVTLQVFNVGAAFSSFVFAAVMTERRRARAALSLAALELEDRVRQRTSELSAANARLGREIRERQRADEDLRRTGALLAQAQQIARIGGWEWDIGADVVTWSDELFRIFGLRPREFEATYEGFLRLIHHEDRDRVHAMVQQALGERTSFEFDARIIRTSGEERVVRSRGEVMVDASGTPVRMVATGQDITEQRRAEDVLRRFIANASHELRTPLTTISGYAEALASKGRDLPEEMFEEFLEALGRQGERARHLVESLLDLSRAEQGAGVSRSEPVALAEATRRVIEAVSPPDGTSVDILVPGDMVVLADSGALERALINLLTNAYKYGGPHVRIEAQEHDGEPRIVVTDDGPGVPDETIPHLFEPFSRGVGAPGIGSGLGLAIARSLVESFGGEIHYEPGAQGGARFVMKLRSEGP